jgi:hypothetical protein
VYQIFLAVNFGQLGQLKLQGYMQQAKMLPFSDKLFLCSSLLRKNFRYEHKPQRIASFEGMLSVKLFI